MLFKDSSYQEFWWPLSSAERNNLCNFGTGYPEEQFCLFFFCFFFKFGPVVQEMLFERFLLWTYGSPPVQLSRTIYAIFVRALCGTIL